jgi:hypothetical protein
MGGADIRAAELIHCVHRPITVMGAASLLAGMSITTC